MRPGTNSSASPTSSNIVSARRGLAILVAVLATVFIVPYIQLQIQGMGAVVNAMSYGAIDLKIAAIISFIVAEAFILVSGLRGSAWVSVLKDGLVILAVAFLAIYVPLHYFDGLAPLLDLLVGEKSQWLTFPGAGEGIYGGAWFISTIILNGITITVFPTSIAGYLSGTSANALRRNSILLPWYQLLLLVPMMVGVAALFVVPALKDADLALFSVVIDSLPAPIVADHRRRRSTVGDRADERVHALGRIDVGQDRPRRRSVWTEERRLDDLRTARRPWSAPEGAVPVGVSGSRCHRPCDEPAHAGCARRALRAQL